MLPLFAADFGGQQGKAAAFRLGQQGIDDLLHRLPFHRPAAFRAVGNAHPRKEQAQVVVNFGNGADGGAGIVGYPLLVNGNGRGQALDIVHIRLVHPPQKLAGVGGQGLHIAALPLGVDGVKGQGAFAGAGDPGNDHQLVAGDGHFHIFKVMLPRALDIDIILRHLQHPLGGNGVSRHFRIRVIPAQSAGRWR